MDKPVENGFVNKLHLIYIIICFSIAVISILVITIWHGQSASTGLNNAATASSIVLAVVAIVMTIVDIAGQRNTISDLRDTARDLKGNLDETKEILESVSNLETKLQDSMSTLQKNHDELIKSISALQERYQTEGESKVVEDLEGLKMFIRPNPNSGAADNISSTKRKNDKIRREIELLLKEKKETTFSDIRGSKNISDLLDSEAQLRGIITGLIRSGKIVKGNSGYSLRKHVEKAL